MQARLSHGKASESQNKNAVSAIYRAMWLRHAVGFYIAVGIDVMDEKVKICFQNKISKQFTKKYVQEMLAPKLH
jgi:hypothetical protein